MNGYWFGPAIAAIAIMIAGVAEAHPRLVGSTLSVNTAAQRVTKLQLKFSERLVGPLTSAAVMMTGTPGNPHLAPVKIGGFGSSIGADGKTLTLVRGQPLPAGTYNVVRRAVSVDTHRVAGNFTFAVK
jgi:methionine-rich copper-binding protein CopC